MPRLSSPCLNLQFSVPDPAMAKAVVTSTRDPPPGCEAWENLGPIDAIKVRFPQLVSRRPLKAGGKKHGAVEGEGHTADGATRGDRDDSGNVEGGGEVKVEEKKGEGEVTWEVVGTCGVDCYAKVGSTVLVNTAVLLVGQPRIDAATKAVGYSPAFGLVLPQISDVDVPEAAGDADAEMLHATVAKFLQDEAAAVEARIKEFERQERAQLEALKLKAERHRAIMATLIQQSAGGAPAAAAVSDSGGKRLGFKVADRSPGAAAGEPASPDPSDDVLHNTILLIDGQDDDDPRPESESESESEAEGDAEGAAGPEGEGEDGWGKGRAALLARVGGGMGAAQLGSSLPINIPLSTSRPKRAK